MIAFLKGVLVGRDEASAYVDVHGVGYAVGMSASSLSKLPERGEPVELFTHLQVREDGVALYGFLSQEEKTLFERLIGVSGIGPKVALAALSFYAPSELVSAIAAQDVARVSRIPGIGKKTAQRMILELKGSLEVQEGLFGGTGQDAAAGGADVRGEVLAQAAEALLSMGFTQAEADLALKGAPECDGEAALLQYALKRLGSL